MEEWKLRLKQSRENKSLNKTTFAKLVGVSNATVTDWEKSVADGGIKELSAPSLVRIHEVLDVDLYWLLSGKGTSEQASNPKGIRPQGEVAHVKPVRAVAPAGPVRASTPDMLQWVSTTEANLLTDFRTLEAPEREVLLETARSLPRPESTRSNTDQG